MNPEDWTELRWEIDADRERRGYWRYELSAEGVRLLAESGGALIIAGNNMKISSTLMPEAERELREHENVEFVRGLDDE